MTLGEKQRLLPELLIKLFAFIYDKGWAVTLGDAYRDPRVFGMVGDRKGYGKPGSNHKVRLAIDLNLFKPDENGRMEYVTSTEGHKDVGEYWETLHPDCRWGGRFMDGNHYSIEYNGRR